MLRRDPRTVPYPALAENTLVLSSAAVVGTADSPGGALALMVRCGCRPAACLGAGGA